MSLSLALVSCCVLIWAVYRSTRRDVDSQSTVVVITILCWTQNFLLPFFYTERFIEGETALALILVKEMLLLVVLAQTVTSFARTGIREIPPPIRWAIAYAVIVGIRCLLGVSALDEPPGSVLRLARGMLLPFEAVLVAYVIGYTSPSFVRMYERVTVTGLTILAIVAMALYFGTTDEFWVNHVNIALYNVEVKGDSEVTVLFDRGVSATAAGREFFEWIASLRLLGTFGDPLTAGFVMSVGLLFIIAREELDARAVTAAAIISAAVFLTFSRSVWIFCTVTFLYLSYVRGKTRHIIAFLVVVAIAWMTVPGFQEFFSGSLEGIKEVNPDAGDGHGRGLATFYSMDTLSTRNILGEVLLDPADSEESGWYHILTQLGVGPFIAFIGLCFSVERYLRRSARREALMLGAAGFALATLVVMNFSFYPFAFTGYYGIWTVVGLAIGIAHAGAAQQDQHGRA